MGLRKRPGRGGISSGGGGGSGGLLGIIGLGKGNSSDATANQPVSQEMADASGGGGYYNNQGQVVQQPFSDTRSFIGKVIGRPNTAAQYNNLIGFNAANAQAQIPSQLQFAQGQSDIARKTALAEAQDKAQLESTQTADTNPLYNNPALASVQEPGDVPYSYSIDPQKAIYDRNMPFVGDTLGGKKANAQFTESGLAQSFKAKEDQARALANVRAAVFEKSGQFPTNITLQPTALETANAAARANAPATHFDTSGEIFQVSPTGDVTNIGEAGKEQPVSYVNGKAIPNPRAGMPYYRSFKPLGNKPYKRGDYSKWNLTGPASSQVQENVVAPGQNGGPPATAPSVGGALQTQPNSFGAESEPSPAPFPRIRSYPGRSSGGVSKPEYQGSGTTDLTVEPTQLQQLLERIRQRRALGMGVGPKY